MTDEKRNAPSDDAHDRVILELLESADPGRTGNLDELGSADELARLRREYREVLGLLAYELEPGSPAPEAKQRILVAIAESEPEQDVRSSLPRAEGVGASRAGGGWLLPLAASIAMLLMAISGWLVLEVRGQRVLIADLSTRLDQARNTTQALATSQGMLAEVRSRLEMMTDPGAQFCALRPPEGSAAPGALGMVVMHPAKDEWFLRVQGLEPCSQGRKYVVWFSTESGAMPGPIFAVKAPGDDVELTLSGMPPKIDAIMITLEPDPAPRTPSMDPLLFGDERTQVL